MFRKKFAAGDDDDDSWTRVEPEGTNFTATVKNLVPGREYEIVAVSVADFRDGSHEEARSAPIYVRTAGDGTLGFGNHRFAEF
jgi:hypothetical protein